MAPTRNKKLEMIHTMRAVRPAADKVTCWSYSTNFCEILPIVRPVETAGVEMMLPVRRVVMERKRVIRRPILPGTI